MAPSLKMFVEACVVSITSRDKISWITYFANLIVLTSLLSNTGNAERNPTMLSNPVIMRYHEGEKAILYCSVDDLGRHTIAWRKLPNPAPLTIGTRRFVKDNRLHAEHVPNSSQWNLVLENVQVRDRGEYECQVSHRKTKLRHRVTLQVIEKQKIPLPRIEISGQTNVRLGATLELSCNLSLVDKDIAKKIEWSKGRKLTPLYHSPRYTIYTSVSVTHHNSCLISSTLRVNSARIADSDTYSCGSSGRLQWAAMKVEVHGASMKRAEVRGDHRPGDVQDYFWVDKSPSRSNGARTHYVTEWIGWLCLVAWFLTTCNAGELGNWISHRSSRPLTLV